jgi:transcriptional regulator with XRE-family HTH domain
VIFLSLAEFLRKSRGDLTYAQFGRKVGMSPSTLFRLEQRQQSITLGALERLLARLKADLDSVFPQSSGRGGKWL